MAEMKGGGAWKRTGRVNGSDAGRMATRVWRCSACRVFNYVGWDAVKKKEMPPVSCRSCGRMDFEYYHSEGEATHMAALELEVRAGLITDLRRQVALPLMTIGPNGLPAKWGEMIVDYAFKVDGVQVYRDWKPAEGPSPDAVLKLRCLEAQGIVVELYGKKGRM